MARCGSLDFFHPIRIGCWWVLVCQVGCRPIMKWQSRTSFTASLSLLRPFAPLELGVGGCWSTKRGVDSTLWSKALSVAPSSTPLDLGVGGRRPARLGVGPLRSGKSQVHSRHHDFRFARQYESNAIRFHAPRFRFLLKRSFSECALFLPDLS